MTSSLQNPPRPMEGCGPALSHAEAQRVQRYQDRLARALAQRDRTTLRRTKQYVLAAAYQPRRGVTPALRNAMRQLSWHMAAMLLTRDRSR